MATLNRMKPKPAEPPAPEKPPVVYVSEPQTLIQGLRDVWRHRRAIRPLIGSVLEAQYKYTVLGLWWVPIIVFFTNVGRTLIFGRLLNIPSAPGIPYFLFLLTGMLAWTIFDRTLIFGLRGFSRYNRLNRDLTFPMPFVPIGATGQGMYLFVVHGALVCLALGYYSLRLDRVLIPLDARLLLAPLGILWCFVLAWGFGFFFAPIYARARDIRFILRLVLPFWMYVTPIVYPLDSVGSKAQLLAQINPVAPPIELFKEGVFGQGYVDPVGVVVSAATTITLVVGGLIFMNRWGPRLVGTDLVDETE